MAGAGVGVLVGVSVIVGVRVMVGVRVIVGVIEAVGVASDPEELRLHRLSKVRLALNVPYSPPGVPVK